MSRLSPMAKRRRHGRTETVIRNILRRVAVRAATALEATIDGFVDAEGNVETDKAEVFGAAGVVHIPASGDKAEAIVGHLGGDANAAVAIATRNADLVRRIEVLEGTLKTGATYLASSDGAARVVLENGTAPLNPLAEPTYKATTHEVFRKALDTAIATAAAGVGGGVTSAINAARAAFEAAFPTFQTGGKLS